jgi:LmbE family N-acetylglucosaminyl deacetylase
MPHPDDAEFGIGGTVARWTREGREVFYVCCTSGDKGTSDVNMTSEKLLQIREAEEKGAASVLGVKEVVFLRYPDQGLDDTAELRKELVRVIRRFKPETVASTDPYRKGLWHRDHRVCGQVVLDAIYPHARDYHAYPDLIKEGFLPHKVRDVLLWGSEEPNYRSDITGTFETKIAALRCHESQVGGEGSDTLTVRLRERAKASAKGETFELAEDFRRIEAMP